MKKTRNLIWDNYKGILIFLVVFAHFLYAHSSAFPNSYANQIVTFIYLFHMPAFIFCSGYFSVSNGSRSKKSIIKLLMYYLIFNTLMMLYLYFSNDTDLEFTLPYNSYWYLFSLILWRLSIKYLGQVKRIIPISIIIALLIGYHPDFNNILSIKRTIAFFPFFVIGYKMAKGEILLKLNNFVQGNIQNKKIRKITLVIFIIFSLLVYILINKYDITYTMLLMGPYNAYRDVFARILIFIVAFVMSVLILLLCPNKYIPVLSKAGKNSLGIYVLHRFITLIFLEIYPPTIYSNMLIFYSLILSILLVLLFSSDKLNQWLTNIATKLTNNIMGQKKPGKLVELGISILIISLLALKPAIYFAETRFGNIEIDTSTVEVLTPQLKGKIDSATKITYVGDLTLLKDQVASAYDLKEDKHYFSNIFKYSKSYLTNSDLTIGVLGGPTAGDSLPYSSSNFTEKGNPIINMPDSYIQVLKESGIDLINTANNHMFDAGYDGVVRTIDNLDQNGIKHLGTYKDEKSRNNVLVVDVNGIKIAVLSYLSNINGNKVSDIYKKYPYITSIIPRSTSKNYNKFYQLIKKDFKNAKATKADLILVMMHSGVDYDHENSKFHDKWNELFSSFGADIIIGNTSNSVGSIEYKDNTLILNSAGNFVNSYQKYDGDSSSIINIYIDKNTKKPIATEVIPMYSQEQKDGYYRALPIYDAINNKDIYETISKFELKRIEESLKTTTKIMLKNEISFIDIEKSYYFIDNKYYEEEDFRKIIESCKNKKLYKLMSNSKRITYIGDSVTYGGKNNYHPYYEPLMNYFQGRFVINLAKNGFTTKMVLDKYKKEIANSKSDLYIIALGVNDIRFRNSKICAMNSTEYIRMMGEIIKLIKQSNSNASIVLVSPWISLTGDKLTILNDDQKKKLLDEYSASLKQYCEQNNYLYINPNNYIEKIIKNNKDKYMTDYIHPNNNYGIRLYSEALLKESK